MLTRKFSRREKILLMLFIVLMIGCLYFILIHQPVSEAVEAAVERQAQAESDLLVSSTMLSEKLRMQTALDELNSDTDAVVPDYDNARRVVELLNGAMLNTESYNLTFRQLEIVEPIVSRGIDISFVCNSYDTAKQILTMLHDGPYRCEISSLNMTLNGLSADAARAKAEAEAAAAAAAAGEEGYVNYQAEAIIPSLANSGLSVNLTVTFYEFLP